MKNKIDRLRKSLRPVKKARKSRLWLRIWTKLSWKMLTILNKILKTLITIRVTKKPALLSRIKVRKARMMRRTRSTLMKTKMMTRRIPFTSPTLQSRLPRASQAN